MDREAINLQLDSATWDDCLTQYIAFEKVRRVLAKDQIYIARPLLSSDDGYVVLNLSVTNHDMGMQPDGTVKPFLDFDEQYKLYFEWVKNDACDGYVVFTEIVNDEELNEILSDRAQETV